MDGHIRKYNGQIEINDLIGDAVKNAVARRSQAMDSEGALSTLSNEEARGIVGMGGIIVTHPPKIETV
jgi:hypothetical protein